MRLLFAIALFTVVLGNATTATTDGNFETENDKKSTNKETREEAKKKNLHSLKKWKVTVEYKNGGVISKTIVVNNNSKLSALETAFAEADKYIKDVKNVKNYSVSPVTDSYVILAGE